MKNVAIPILVAVIFIIMAVYLVTFQVRETESVLVTRFGAPVREKTEPGLAWKWPAPIERIHPFDSRLRVLENESTALLGEGRFNRSVDLWQQVAFE